MLLLCSLWGFSQFLPFRFIVSCVPGAALPYSRILSSLYTVSHFAELFPVYPVLLFIASPLSLPQKERRERLAKLKRERALAEKAVKRGGLTALKFCLREAWMVGWLDWIGLMVYGFWCRYPSNARLLCSL